MTTATKTANKVADLRYIVTPKSTPHIKIYIYRSSDDSKNYEVTAFEGRVTSCTTPSVHPCYICKDAQKREDACAQDRDAERTAFNNFALSMGF